MSPLPTSPWQEVSIDFKDLSSGEYLLVITDDYSRYPVVEIVRSTSAKAVIPKLDKFPRQVLTTTTMSTATLKRKKQWSRPPGGKKVDEHKTPEISTPEVVTERRYPQRNRRPPSWRSSVSLRVAFSL
ncbi:hypothetical protein QZH41_010333 [Actinostola sp. cb2023]|nr:hypothetical protein QZH41_010333 [Actinostola sp. cb2023]